VHHSQDNDFVSDRRKVDRIRKPSYERPTGVTMDARIGQGFVEDSRYSLLNSSGKGSSKAEALTLIPTSCVEELRFRFRAKDESWRHAPPVSLRRTSSHGTAEPGFAR
jgi:hypothetical protein